MRKQEFSLAMNQFAKELGSIIVAANQQQTAELLQAMQENNQKLIEALTKKRAKREKVLDAEVLYTLDIKRNISEEIREKLIKKITPKYNGCKIEVSENEVVIDFSGKEKALTENQKMSYTMSLGKVLVGEVVPKTGCLEYYKMFTFDNEGLSCHLKI